MKIIPRLFKTGGEVAVALASAGVELAREGLKSQNLKKKPPINDKVLIKPKNPRVWLWPS